MLKTISNVLNQLTKLFGVQKTLSERVRPTVSSKGVSTVMTAVAGILIAGSVFASCDNMYPKGKPIVKSTPISEHITYLCRKAYVLEHSSVRHTAYWVAERLQGNRMGTESARVNAFKVDPDLQRLFPGESATPADYDRSGFDRGHMAPVGDMHGDAAAMLESFYMSNMAPQHPENNRNGWRALELWTREMAQAKGVLFVITGPAYITAMTPATIGRSKVAVPSHFYKILYNPKTDAIISFLVPNVPITQKDLPKYVTSVMTIQKATRIVFFPKAVLVKEATQMWTAKSE